MKCSLCGSVALENALFCSNCGAKLEAEQVLEATPVVHQDAPAASEWPPAGAQGQAYAPPTATYAQPVYAQGCVAAAVADVKGDPLLIKNTLLLALIACVPILNFVLYGYAVNWAREIPFGGRTRMPQKIVTGHNFEIGFYAFLISLVISLVLGFASMALALIPILGAVAIIALSLGGMLFQSLLQMRLGMSQQLSEGFKIRAAWDAMQKNWTGLMCAVFVPALVASGILLAVSLVGGLLIGIAAFPAAATGSAMLTGSYIIATVFIMVALILVSGAVMAVMTIVSARAVGHWIARFSPEWVAEVQQYVAYM